MSDIPRATKIVLTDTKYRLLFLAIWVGFFLVMFFIPVVTIPGDDAVFQSKLFSGQDYLLLAVVSGISALIMAMQIRIFHVPHHAHVTSTAVGAGAGFAAAIFATSTCTLCLGALVSFLGAGTIFTLSEHRLSILFGSLLLLTVSLHFSSRRLVQGCTTCHI